MELQAIAAAVVGGVSTAGGVGSAFGAFLGASLIGVLEQGLRRMPQINEFWRYALLGVLILVAVIIDTVIMNRLRRLWARHELQMASYSDDTEQENPAHVA
jgi:ribose/xylose/arabinose/galactoside ABC-type transport system permease subunit